MRRTTEANLSKINMSRYKTIYVEGDIDLNMLESFLSTRNISNILIYRIMADRDNINFDGFECDERIGAKKIIIEYIKHANSDATIEKNKYLGIVDLDFDIPFSVLENIDNLIYTDRNSMESYLIDIDLFKTIARENKIDNIDIFETNFQAYIENFQEFNIMFSVQVRHYTEFNSNLISFDDVPLSDEKFLKLSENYKIDTDEVIKCKCKGCKTSWKTLFVSKKDNIYTMFDNLDVYIYTHGKHALRYIIGIFKRLYKNVSTYSDDKFANLLKDKFIIQRKYQQYALFEKVETFANK